MKALRLTEEQLLQIQKRVGRGKVRTHLFPGVDIDRIHRHPKYGNHKTEIDGITFDSKREADRYQDLRLMEKAGEITELDRQVRFELKVKGYIICSYIADFTYRKGGPLVVEDSKGVKTREYIIKKKLMKAIHGIEVIES